jgi:hypothetical protein
MQPYLPFWFRQRQGKAEPIGEDRLRLSAPNMAEAFIGIEKNTDSQWLPVVRKTPDSENLVSTNTSYGSPQDAWDAAFEVYRETFVV